MSLDDIADTIIKSASPMLSFIESHWTLILAGLIILILLLITRCIKIPDIT